MMQNVNAVSRRCWAALIALCLANLAVHLAFYAQMPDVVPTHWGASGAPDAWGSKAQTLLLDALPLLLLPLFWLTPRIDPKGRAYERSGRVYQGFVALFTVVMAAMTWVTEATVFGWLPSERAAGLVVPVLIGAMFVVMGNYLPRVRQNYTFGIKTPWTLDDPENWRRTQRFGGVCFVVVGLALMAVGLLGGGAAGVIACAAVILLAVTAMFAYSYLLWRRAR